MKLTAVVIAGSFFFLFAVDSKAQQPDFRFNRDQLSSFDKALNQRNAQEHAGIQPAAFGLEKSFYELKDSTHKTDAFSSGFKVTPILNIAGGYQYLDRTAFTGDAVAGIAIDWHYHDRWGVQLGYTFWGRKTESYLRDYSDSLHIIPGVGYSNSNGEGTFNAQDFYGNISYRAGKYFHFEAGKGKHFWGDGYRSFFMSEYPSSYPYFRLTTKIWHIKYTNLWAQMKDISYGQPFGDSRKKYVAMHALSWNISKMVNVTLFEMVVWQDKDTLNRRTLEMNYLNPVIFYRPVEFAQGSADNEILGLSFKIKAPPHVQVYGQLVLDEFLLREVKAGDGWWANKFGTQLGLKFFDVITPGFNIQTELNLARPFTYTHGSQIQSWTHLNQPLAHPLGTNFVEWVNMFRYDHGDWKFSEKLIWSAYGRDYDSDPDLPGVENYGGNIFRSYKGPYRQYGNEMLQGLKSTVYYNELEVTRNIHSKLDLELFGNFIIRFEKNDVMELNDQFIMIGIRSRMMLKPVRDF